MRLIFMKKYILKFLPVLIFLALVFFRTVPIFSSSMNKTEEINQKINQLEDLRLACYVMSVYYSDLRYVSASYYEDPLENQMDKIILLTGHELKSFVADKMESFALKDLMENYDKYDDDDLTADELFFKYEVIPKIINLYAQHGADGLSMGTGEGISIYNEFIQLSDQDIMQSMLMPIYLVYYYNFAIEKIEFLLSLSKAYIDQGISSKDYDDLVRSMEQSNNELIARFDSGNSNQGSVEMNKILYKNIDDWRFVDNPEGNLEREVYDLLLNPEISSGGFGLIGIIIALGLAGIFVVSGGVIYKVTTSKKPSSAPFKPDTAKSAFAPFKSDTAKPAKPSNPELYTDNVLPPSNTPRNDTISNSKASGPEDSTKDNKPDITVNPPIDNSLGSQLSEKDLYIKTLCEKYNTTPEKLKGVIQEKINSNRKDAKSWEKKATAMAIGENAFKLATVTSDAIVDGLGNVTGIPGVKIKAAYKIARSTTATLAEKGFNTRNFIGGSISGAGNAALDFVENHAIKSTITVIGETFSGAVTDGIKGAKDGFVRGSYNATANYYMDKISSSSLRKKVSGKSFIEKNAGKMIDNAKLPKFVKEYSKTVINTSTSTVNEFIFKPVVNSII